ncbi:TPA: hypothetical protein ACM6VM_004334, partial [Escherichia coli]
IFSHTDFTNKNTLLFVCVAIVLWFNNLIYAKKTLYLRSIKVIVRKFSDSDLTSATGNSLRMKRNSLTLFLDLPRSERFWRVLY